MILNNINFAPNLFRDDILRKSKVSLNIPLNDTKMFHVSPNRVTAGLYHGVPTVSVQCRCSSWLKPMIRMLNTENFVEELQNYLQEEQYKKDIKTFRNHFIDIPMAEELKRIIEDL